MTKTTEQAMAEANHNARQRALMYRILDGLRQTARIRPISPDDNADRVVLEFTDESARFLAPLVEAVDILEAIIFASDGCMGHKHCAHSMEPWQRARALLRGKWDAETNREQWPSLERQSPEAREAGSSDSASTLNDGRPLTPLHETPHD